jgi:hypothetical protein
MIHIEWVTTTNSVISFHSQRENKKDSGNPHCKNWSKAESTNPLSKTLNRGQNNPSFKRSNLEIPVL